MGKLTLLLLSIVFLADNACACPILEKAYPRVGSVVEKSPGYVALTFSSTVFPESSTVDVTDAKGNKVSTGKPYGKGGDNAVFSKIQPLSPGKYTVSWNVFCDCGSLTPGTYKFTVK